MFTKSYIDLTETIQFSIIKGGYLQGNEEEDDHKDGSKDEDDDKNTKYDDIMVDADYSDVDC